MYFNLKIRNNDTGALSCYEAATQATVDAVLDRFLLTAYDRDTLRMFGTFVGYSHTFDLETFV